MEDLAPYGEVKPCKVCKTPTVESIKYFTGRIPICWKCLKEITYRGLTGEVLKKHWEK